MRSLGHILIFTKEYLHPRISVTGGTGVFYKNLAEKLTERGYQVSVFGSHKKAVSFQENNIRFKFVKDYFNKNILTELLRSLSGKHSIFSGFHNRLYIKEKRYLITGLKLFIDELEDTPDIIESHDWDGISLFLNELNIPYVVRFHGSWTVLQKYFGYNVGYGRVSCEKLALPKSNNNIAVSEFSRAVNEELFQIKNTKIIYNGIDTDYWKPYPKSDFIPCSIFYFGEVKEEKGATIALQAFLRLRKEIPQATLHFIGHAGKFEQHLRSFAGEDIENSIKFYGRQKGENIKRLIGQAQIMLFPSKGENFSLSLLEAMAMEKAVICSAIPAFEEIITDGYNGMLANSPEVFAEKALVLFRQNELRTEMARMARKTVKQRFDTDHMVNQTLLYYQEIYERPQ